METRWSIRINFIVLPDTSEQKNWVATAKLKCPSNNALETQSWYDEKGSYSSLKSGCRSSYDALHLREDRLGKNLRSSYRTRSTASAERIMNSFRSDNVINRSPQHTTSYSPLQRELLNKDIMGFASSYSCETVLLWEQHGVRFRNCALLP